jgi:hypothetical protein
VMSVVGQFPIISTLSVLLPGLTGQSSTPGRCLLDRPVEPGDDSKVRDGRYRAAPATLVLTSAAS